MGIRDTLRKAAGLLVELPPEATAAQAGDAAQADVDAILSGMKSSAPPSARTVEQIVHESEGPNLEEIKANTIAGPAVAPADGEVDVAAVYQQAGVPTAPFTAEQTLEMLGSLPPELPLDTKRQTVKVTLSALGKTMGATPDTIVADASRKLAALAAYQDHVSQQTETFVVMSQQEITQLQSQIEAKRKEIETAGLKMRQLTARCETESHRLDEVLEFFSLDVPPSKHAPEEKEQPAGGIHPAPTDQ